jgi:hypothetical protein
MGNSDEAEINPSMNGASKGALVDQPGFRRADEQDLALCRVYANQRFKR